MAESNSFKYARLLTKGVERFDGLNQLLAARDVSRETWLFACPHDDDIAVGAGLWLHAAVLAGVQVHVLIATDGRMGYCTLDQRDRIVGIRREECLQSYETLGLPRECVHMLGFPDCDLMRYQGRRPAATDDPQVEGFTGLQNAFVHALRQLRPDRLLMPAPSDYHPDHQIVHNEMQISLFHASGAIWPELGEPTHVPEVYELAIYCDFPAPPNLELLCDDASFHKKLQAIEAYQSQAQIAVLVDKIRASGPVEYLREVNFRFYDPQVYRSLFSR